MMDVLKLKVSITEKGLTQSKVAKQIGVSPQAFSAKLKRGVFGSDEIEKMVRILELKNPVSIFFATK